MLNKCLMHNMTICAYLHVYILLHFRLQLSKYCTSLHNTYCYCYYFDPLEQFKLMNCCRSKRHRIARWWSDL